MRPVRRALMLVIAALSALSCASKKSASAGPEPPVVPGVLVDEVVATVLGRPITLSEVELEARIARAGTGDVAGAISGTLTREEMATMLSELVDRTAVLRGLRSLYPNTVDPRAADLEIARLRRVFPSAEQWERFLARIELTEEEVRERRRRALEASAIVDAKLADVARVDSDLIEEYMRKNGISDRKVAEERLLAKVSDELRRGIIADARRATSVRVIEPLVAQPVTKGMEIRTP